MPPPLSPSPFPSLLLRPPTPSARNLFPTIHMSLSSAPNHPSNGRQEEDLPQVLKYHNATKHSLTRYSRGPHSLDWANQPSPFRRYISSPLVPLLHPPAPDPNPRPYPPIFPSLPNPNLTKPLISDLLFHSLALSAWKSTGPATWPLRVNPSSGNLHPTEAYLISPPIDSLLDSGFVAHYAPRSHGLEIRAEVPFPAGFLPESSFLVGFSSVFWREAWKYGERGFRYCNHDVGHAIGAVSVAAAASGFDVRVLDGLGHGELSMMMGLGCGDGFRVPDGVVRGRIPEVESEHPDCMLAVFPSGNQGFEVDYEGLRDTISSGFSGLEWKGTANSLSKEHVCWDEIYRTAEAVKKPSGGFGNEVLAEPVRSSAVFRENVYKGFSVREVVRRRRSAVDMDGVTAMERDVFYQIMLRCLPSGCGGGEGQMRQLAMPFRALPWDAEVHAALFVHRVYGLSPGLYFLVRNEEHLSELKSCMRPDFEWAKPEGCPEELPLFVLDRGDYRLLSQRLSCHQEIASDGCFSLGMIAQFEPVLREKVWMYPRLFWETGVLGQVLYLEAHAVGISATGIGCFFDDHVHEVLGLKGLNFQSLYHFTVGGPVEDVRIMSLPAYPGPGIDSD